MQMSPRTNQCFSYCEHPNYSLSVSVDALMNPNKVKYLGKIIQSIICHLFCNTFNIRIKDQKTLLIYKEIAYVKSAQTQRHRDKKSMKYKSEEI